MENVTTARHLVKVEQLQPGVFIELDGGWMDHPFLFNKFKIKNQKQIETLRSCGIGEVVYHPDKSEAQPLPAAGKVVAGAPPAAATVPEVADPDIEKLWQKKKEKAAKLRAKRENLKRCTENYHSTLKDVPKVMNFILAGGKEGVEAAGEMVGNLVENFLADTDSLVHLINAKETAEGVYYHSLNVSVLALMLGKKVQLTPAEMQILGMGALFHDIGKSRIDKKLLLKPPPLTKAETELMRLHPRYGVEIVGKSGTFPEAAKGIIWQHHELCNGQGYPQGLRGKDITRLTKMTGIVDTYENLCNPVEREKALTPFQALAYMYKKMPDRLDMELFGLFIKCLGVYPPGTLVELSNGTVALVVSVNPANHMKPSLMLYDPGVPRTEALIYDLEDEPEVRIEKSLHPEKVPGEVANYFRVGGRVNYFIDAGKQKGRAY